MKKPTAFGKYFLLERINIGGMAEVFRAKAFGVEGFERLVAVKRILANVAEDKEFIRMFIEEAKLSVQLNHANIAQIFDLGVVDGSYYIALEHVHGRDLRGIFDRCRQLGEAMPVAQACFIAMKVCEGLDYAHNKRDQAGRELALVHRDVSPQNILVSFEGEVKLIDFGIAKAAGNGSKTQAGILKGKFGYMSPEQVRGVPVDRRSDVFSCGIVLYELLTGERLFVGESDFSTLEKVRNVEILPPSTYNRKIPDELERIVLKALTKDVDDRYQNAIDLHDELQAFVYTAGEFYSRKDLAGWMKKTFAKEIEDETAKLESYRQLKPPPNLTTPAQGEPVMSPMSSGPPVPPSRPTPMPTKPPQRQITQPVQLAPAASSQPIQAMPVAQSGPIPSVVSPVAQVSSPVASGSAVRPPPPPVSRSQPVPVVPQPEPMMAAGTSGELAEQGGLQVSPALDPSSVGWEDDEVETQIYADQDKELRQSLSQVQGLPQRPSLPLQPPQSSPAISLAAAGAIEVGPAVPDEFPAGSTDVPEPRYDGREISAPSRLISDVHDVPFDPMSSFGARVGAQRADNRRALLLVIAGGAAIAVVTVAAVVLLKQRANQQVALAPPPAPAPVKADPNTGFDLYVTPSGIMQWKLDGDSRTDRLPSRIRGIAPGTHTVQIEPPPGFLSQLQEVTIEQGKAPRVDIKLQPIAGITGVFDSTPPGANVSLIIDGKRQPIGLSPARSPLDPRSSYQVLFEKPGYVSVNRPISFSGNLEEHVVVSLDKAGTDKPDAAPAPPPPAPAPPAPDRQPRKAVRPPDRTPGASGATGSAPDPAGESTEAAAPASDTGKPQGVLVVGSKPPCEILIDGAPTGLRTPQKEIKLSIGRHKVTLVNSEFNIKETFPVDIKADAPERAIKDYSDRLPH